LIALIKNDVYKTPNTITRFPKKYFEEKPDYHDGLFKNDKVYYKKYLLDTYIAILKLYKFLIEKDIEEIMPDGSVVKEKLWFNVLKNNFPYYKSFISKNYTTKKGKINIPKYLDVDDVIKSISYIVNTELLYLEGLLTESINTLSDLEQKSNLKHLKGIEPPLQDFRLMAPLDSSIKSYLTSLVNLPSQNKLTSFTPSRNSKPKKPIPQTPQKSSSFIIPQPPQPIPQTQQQQSLTKNKNIIRTVIHVKNKELVLYLTLKEYKPGDFILRLKLFKKDFINQPKSIFLKVFQNLLNN
jgi:hypothetical protein